MEKEELKLVEPTLEYKEQVMEYRKIFLEFKWMCRIGRCRII